MINSCCNPWIGYKQLPQSWNKLLLLKEKCGILLMRSTRSSPAFILLNAFLQSRRQGSSPRTIEFYECCLRSFVQNYELTTDGVNKFLSDLKCGNGKHGYYRALRAFCNWLYRNDYVKYNPIEKVDPPKPTKKILPSLSPEQG